MDKKIYLRTYSGIIGKIESIVDFSGIKMINYEDCTGMSYLVEYKDIKDTAESLIDLFSYEDCLKVFNKAMNGFFYYGMSENDRENIQGLRGGLKEDDNYIVVGLITKEILKKGMFNQEDLVCSTKEQETCQTEKMGCKGCFYNIN